MANSA
jgi:hypothetical protein